MYTIGAVTDVFTLEKAGDVLRLNASAADAGALQLIPGANGHLRVADDTLVLAVATGNMDIAGDVSLGNTLTSIGTGTRAVHFVSKTSTLATCKGYDTTGTQEECEASVGTCSPLGPTTKADCEASNSGNGVSTSTATYAPMTGDGAMHVEVTSFAVLTLNAAADAGVAKLTFVGGSNGFDIAKTSTTLTMSAKEATGNIEIVTGLSGRFGVGPELMTVDGTSGDTAVTGNVAIGSSLSISDRQVSVTSGDSEALLVLTSASAHDVKKYDGVVTSMTLQQCTDSVGVYGVGAHTTKDTCQATSTCEGVAYSGTHAECDDSVGTCDQGGHTTRADCEASNGGTGVYTSTTTYAGSVGVFTSTAVYDSGL